VIANAPNPAGRPALARHLPRGQFAGSASSRRRFPTLVMALFPPAALTDRWTKVHSEGKPGWACVRFAPGASFTACMYGLLAHGLGLAGDAP